MNSTDMPIIIRIQQIWKNTSPKLSYIGLWIFLALMMVMLPFVQRPHISLVFIILFALLLGVATMTIRGSRRLKLIAILMLTMAVTSQIAFSLIGGNLLELFSYISASATLLWTTFFLFLSLFKTKEVTSATLWEAVTVYILIGLTWASIYSTLEVMIPGSFEDSIFPDAAMDFHTFIYYSFVTLATLGYGDIIPTTQVARGVVILEILTGVMYMAILISRLVGTWKPVQRE